MHNKLLLPIAAAGLLVAAGSAQAVVIDNFDTGQQVLQSTNNSEQSNGIGSLATTDTIGGARKVRLFNVSGANALNTAVATVDFSNSNELQVSNATGVNSQVWVTWDGTTADPSIVNTTGLNGVDLSGSAQGFLFTIAAIDTNVSLDFQVWDMSNNTATVTNTFSAPVPGFFIPFASFGGVAMNSVGAIQLRLSGPVAWDGRFDQLDTRPNPTPVPGTLALLGLGLAGLGIRRRKAA